MYIRRSIARVNASHANTISPQEAIKKPIYLPRRYWVWPDCMIALLVRGQPQNIAMCVLGREVGHVQRTHHSKDKNI
jgi:hypothetical protein